MGLEEKGPGRAAKGLAFQNHSDAQEPKSPCSRRGSQVSALPLKTDGPRRPFALDKAANARGSRVAGMALLRGPDSPNTVVQTPGSSFSARSFKPLSAAASPGGSQLRLGTVTFVAASDASWQPSQAAAPAFWSLPAGCIFPETAVTCDLV